MQDLAPALGAGFLLRLFFILRYGQTTVDTRIYGEFARNLLQHGVYGFTNIVHGVTLAPLPTLIRLPGYPLFLAACFRLFGMDNYTAVMFVQAAVDLWTCLLVAGIAARIVRNGADSRRAGLAALWLAVLCPFTANYVAAPLTETLTLWTIALAFYALQRWQESPSGVNRWLFTMAFALAYSILLRPEQGLLAAAVVPAVLAVVWRTRGGLHARTLQPALLLGLLTILPLVPWTARNWHTFHVFQPLAPRYATDPHERINFGFQRWYRTWAIEFASTQNVYWNYDGGNINIADLPNRAFDTQEQYAETEAVLRDYNLSDQPTAALDARFDSIAAQRIHANPARYYLLLPAARVTNMILRPRTELLPVPLEWWRFPAQHRAASVFALFYALLNAAYLALGFGGFWRCLRRGKWEPVVWAMFATILMRTLLLLTMDNSEERYTLEFFPALIPLAAITLVRLLPVPATSSRALR